MTQPLVEVANLTKDYPAGRRRLLRRRRKALRAVDGVSFTIESGSALGLVGESGCGKSTLAKMLVGIESPTRGSILLDGQDLCAMGVRDRHWTRRRIQMIFQDPAGSLDPRRTLGQSLIEPLAIHRVGTRRERLRHAIGLLEAVGLSSRDLNRFPHELSGGQRQRVVIARALALEPDLIVCDEPVSALDVSIQAQIVNLLKELRARFGIAYLFIAHDLAIVREVCDRIAVMYLGRIVEEAPRDELFDAPRHPYTRALLSSIPVPDPVAERERETVLLPGDVPSPLDQPLGCPFHPRCAEKDEVAGGRCEREPPALLPVDGATTRLAACHLGHPNVSGAAEAG